MNICEIFHSIQGESSFVGQPCVFVRLTGCNLRCRWCDTTYAYQGGKQYSVNQIIDIVREYGCQLVEITGGEPMVQHDEVIELMKGLLEIDKTVLVETNGSLPLNDIPVKVHRIIDLKPPKSGTAHHEVIWNRYALDWRPTDEIKCVVADRSDFDWCMDKLAHYGALDKVIIHFSPVWGELEPKQLAEWVCASRYPVRLNLQIQKIIWDPTARGV